MSRTDRPRLPAERRRKSTRCYARSSSSRCPRCRPPRRGRCVKRSRATSSSIARGSTAFVDDPRGVERGSCLRRPRAFRRPFWASAARIHLGARRVRTRPAQDLRRGAGGDRARRRGANGRGDGGVAPLGPGEELRTGPDASARASLPTGTVVDVGPGARLRFAAAGGGAAVRDRLELAAGLNPGARPEAPGR